MKTKFMSKFFISSVFTLCNQYKRIPYFGLLTNINLQLKPRLLTVHGIELSKLTKMRDNSPGGGGTSI